MKLSKIFMDKKGIGWMRILEWVLAILILLWVASVIYASIKGSNLNIRDFFRKW